MVATAISWLLANASHVEVAGDDGGLALVAFVDDFVEVFIARCTQRLEAKVVDQQQVNFGDGADQFGARSLCARLSEPGLQLRLAERQNLEALAQCLMPDGVGDMGLAGACGTDDQHRRGLGQ